VRITKRYIHVSDVKMNTANRTFFEEKKTHLAKIVVIVLEIMV
jgi:hypothetical protein